MAEQASNRRQEAHREGMERSLAVSRYLNALGQGRRGRGRPRKPEAMQARLREVERRLPDSTGLARLRLTQELKNLERGLAVARSQVDLAALEAEFVRHARAFAEREGIEYATWVACGVPRAVLARAGIFPPGAALSTADDDGHPAGTPAPAVQ